MIFRLQQLLPGKKLHGSISSHRWSDILSLSDKNIRQPISAGLAGAGVAWLT